MNITRVGTQPSAKGPAEWFTGTVRIDPLFQAHSPARAVGASVTFEPGARTAWHTHPLGQTLLITAGCGWVQRAILKVILCNGSRASRQELDVFKGGSPFVFYFGTVLEG